MNNEYNEKDIQVLSDREHVRKRLSIYAGSVEKTTYLVPLFQQDNSIIIKNINFVFAVYKCFNEVVENSIDELQQVDKKHSKKITINANPIEGTYQVIDTGRGVPIGKHETGKYTPEVVFGMLRSGRNFIDNKQSGVIGTNGMGSSITCMCSTTFTVDIKREKKLYHQTFTNGGLVISEPDIHPIKSRQTGTSIEFQLDPDVFEDLSLSNELIRNRAIEIALTNPNIQIEYNGEKFQYKKGFENFIENLSENYFKFTFNGGEIFVLFDVYEGASEQIFSWVNSSLLFNGGLCNTQFINAFHTKVAQHLESAAKKAKCSISREDIVQNLLILGNLKLSDPQYDAQSKTRLTSPSLRNELIDMLDQQWSTFTKQNKKWLDVVLDRSMIRHHSQANRKAVKEHQKNLSKRVPGLIDATSGNRFECMLFISEGVSASSMLTQVRNPKIHASFPLSGKINNVYGSTVAQVLKMSKITNVITAIGLTPGQRAIRSTLNYGKVVISTDADPDGADIFTLLVNLFFQFWPELFDPSYDPFVHRLIAPNVVVSKNDKRIHFPSRLQYEKVRSKYKNWTVEYFKGLGSMHPEDWVEILSGDQYLIPIIDNGQMKETLKLLFSNNADARKHWLTFKD